MQHNAEYWVWFLVMGAIVTRGRGFGIAGDIVIGVVGAGLGGGGANAMGLYASSSLGAFLVVLTGAVLLVGLTRFVKRVASSA